MKMTFTDIAVYQEINFGFTGTSSGDSLAKILPQKAEILFQLFLGLGLGLSLKRDRQRIETLTDKRCTLSQTSLEHLGPVQLASIKFILNQFLRVVDRL